MKTLLALWKTRTELERLSCQPELLPSEKAALRGARGTLKFVAERLEEREARDTEPDWREAQLPNGDREELAR